MAATPGSGATTGSQSTTSIAWRAPDWPEAHVFSPERSQRTCLRAMISAAVGRSSRLSGRWIRPSGPSLRRPTSPLHSTSIFTPTTPYNMFIRIEQGGLLKSTDAGRTFQVIHGMDDDVHRTVINPLNPDQIYLTTGIGMYATSDGGKTWRQWTDLNHEIGG